MIFETTPSQTVGPYFAIGLPFDVGPFAVAEGTPGELVRSHRRCAHERPVSAHDAIRSIASLLSIAAAVTRSATACAS